MSKSRDEILGREKSTGESHLSNLAPSIDLVLVPLFLFSLFKSQFLMHALKKLITNCNSCYDIFLPRSVDVRQNYSVNFSQGQTGPSPPHDQSKNNCMSQLQVGTTRGYVLPPFLAEEGSQKQELSKLYCIKTTKIIKKQSHQRVDIQRVQRKM